MDKNKTIITLTGPSGSGKSTIEKILCNKYGLNKAISHTTRDMRLGEVHGIDYYFVTKEIFNIMEKEGKMAESIEYNGNNYGVCINELMNSQVIVCEPHGVLQIKNHMKDTDVNIVSIYINISKEDQKYRMTIRGDDYINIVKRIYKDSKLFKPDPELYDHIITSITNDSFNDNLANFIYNTYFTEIK